MKRRILRIGSTAAVLLVALSPCMRAQTAVPLNARVTITHIKPDMVNEWMELQKNAVPLLKKAGVTSRTVYSSGLFGDSYEYLTMQPVENMSQFDSTSPLTKLLGQPAAARRSEQLRKCILTQNSFLSTLMPDISFTPDQPTAPIIASARYRIAAGRLQDFENLVKSELLPIYKKANVGLQVRRRTLGANPNDVVMSTMLMKYADLEGGPFVVKQVGADAAARINDKFKGIRTLIEVTVRSRVADLSF
jgi:hypothetical protein